jgi:hypothetical protein
MKRAELLRMQKQAKARKGQATTSLRTQDVLELIRLALLTLKVERSRPSLPLGGIG